MSVNTDSTTQQAVTEIWEDVLQQKGIGLTDDFFDLGGTSLDLIRVFGRVNETFNLSLDGSVLGDEATIAQTGRHRRRGAAQDLILNRLEKTMDTIQTTPQPLQFASAPRSWRSFTSAAMPGRSSCTSPTRCGPPGAARLQLMDRAHAVYPRALSGNTNIANYDRHLDMDFLADHVGRPQIVDRVVSVLGPDVLCWRTEFFPKYPGDEGTDWHQADTFANASGRPQILWPEQQREFGGTITVWTAFTEATEQTGALQFIPGTHQQMYYDETKRMHYDPESINRTDKEGMRRGFFGYDYRQLQKDPDWKPDEARRCPSSCAPGRRCCSGRR